jgi:hypothetical protein
MIPKTAIEYVQLYHCHTESAEYDRSDDYRQQFRCDLDISLRFRVESVQFRLIFCHKNPLYFVIPFLP